MSAGSLPYQLRANKAVDRHLFVEALHRLDRVLHFDNEYEYIGMGGPFMEDFRVLHERFPTLPMISIEQNVEVQKRQRFNKPHSLITFRHCSVENFIADFEPQTKIIVWLDYTSAAEFLDQTREVQDLLSCLPSLSVLKITINANAGSALEAGGVSLSKQERRVESLKNRFKHLPLDWITPKEVEWKKYPSTVLRLLELSVQEKMAGLPGFTFEPVCTFEYADGQTMVTVTGVFGLKSEVERTLRACRMNRWPFFSGWQHLRRIGLPELSARERFFIRQLLPGFQSNVREIRQKLRFDVAETPEESDMLLHQYISFHRHLPFFERVVF